MEIKKKKRFSYRRCIKEIDVRNLTKTKKASFSLKHVAFKYYSKPLYYIFFLLGLDSNKNTLDTFLSGTEKCQNGVIIHKDSKMETCEDLVSLF